MGETFSGLVTDGPLLIAAGVAALVGLISFASPCVLPLVPSYLAYVSGLVGTGAPAEEPVSGGTATAVRTAVSPRTRMVLGAVLFVLGFTAVFVAFGTAFGGLGRLLLQHADVLNRIFGVITILVGLPSGSRMAARVRSACARALCTMVLTLAALRVGPALGPTR